MGYLACEHASEAETASGNVGAGVGASVGKLYGPQYMMKSGLGNSCLRLENGTKVGCVIAVNAVGDVLDQEGRIQAGAYDRKAQRFVNPFGLLGNGGGDDARPRHAKHTLKGQNTTIGVVATDAGLTKAECKRVAIMATGGLAQAVRPAFTPYDGDTIFVLSTGNVGDVGSSQAHIDRDFLVTQIGILAQKAVFKGVIDAVMSSESILGFQPDEILIYSN